MKSNSFTLFVLVVALLPLPTVVNGQGFLKRLEQKVKEELRGEEENRTDQRGQNEQRQQQARQLDENRIELMDITKELQTDLALPVSTGLYILAFPADAQGHQLIEPGSLLVAINGRRIDNGASLARVLEVTDKRAPLTANYYDIDGVLRSTKVPATYFEPNSGVGDQRDGTTEVQVQNDAEQRLIDRLERLLDERLGTGQALDQTDENRGGQILEDSHGRIVGRIQGDNEGMILYLEREVATLRAELNATRLQLQKLEHRLGQLEIKKE